MLTRWSIWIRLSLILLHSILLILLEIAMCGVPVTWFVHWVLTGSLTILLSWTWRSFVVRCATGSASHSTTAYGSLSAWSHPCASRTDLLLFVLLNNSHAATVGNVWLEWWFGHSAILNWLIALLLLNLTMLIIVYLAHSIKGVHTLDLMLLNFIDRWVILVLHLVYLLLWWSILISHNLDRSISKWGKNGLRIDLLMTIYLFLVLIRDLVLIMIVVRSAGVFADGNGLLGATVSNYKWIVIA